MGRCFHVRCLVVQRSTHAMPSSILSWDPGNMIRLISNTPHKYSRDALRNREGTDNLCAVKQRRRHAQTDMTVPSPSAALIIEKSLIILTN